jgi:alkylhydroperoxidase/carboxymuconolactone decarboxylase family protein YurZ
MQLDELLRRLALNDERAVGMATAAGHGAWREPSLDVRTESLVRLGALLAIGATTASCRAEVDVARAAGATDEEIVGVLIAVGPAVGAARVVAAAPRLALAIDYDIEDADVAWEGP